MFKKRKAKNFFSATLCLCLCFNTNQLFFIPMLPWGIVPMSSLPIGWGGGYMGIANQMLLVQPFCSERWETAFLNYGNDFCLFPFIFLHHHLHILFCTIISSPCAFCSFIFTWLSCGLLCFWHSGVWICGFYFFLCVNSHIYNCFLYIWRELPGHATKFLQLVIFIARSLSPVISQCPGYWRSSDWLGGQTVCCELCCPSSWSSLPMEDTGFWGSAPRLALGLGHYSYNISKEKEAQRNKKEGFLFCFLAKKNILNSFS